MLKDDLARAVFAVAALFLASAMVAMVLQSLFGPVIIEGLRPDRTDMLLRLVAQQVLVVFGLVLVFVRLEPGDTPDRTFVLPRGGGWWVVALLGSLGAANALQPGLQWWAEVLQQSPPSWWDVVVRLDTPLGVTTTVAAVSLVPAIAEESFFRGYVQPRLMRLGLPLAIGLQAAFFALFHLDWFGLPVYLISGLLLGVLRHASGSIWPGVLAHAINNLLGVVEIHVGQSVYEQFGVAVPVAGAAMLLFAAVLGVASARRGAHATPVRNV